MIKIFSLFLIIILLFALSAPYSYGDYLEPSSDQASDITLSDQRDLSWLMSKISISKQMLSNVSLSHSPRPKSYRSNLKKSVFVKTKRGRKRVKKTYYLSYLDWSWKEAALATLEPESGDIEIVKIRKDRQNLYVITPGYEVTFENKPSGLTWNGKNTAFQVLDPKDKPRVVLAVKWQEKPGSPNPESIYIPYSRGLHLKELLLKGEEHLRADASEAFDKLNELRVKSITLPDQLVTQAYQIKDFQRLAEIEHSDPEDFFEFRDCRCNRQQLGDISKEIAFNLSHPNLPFNPYERVWTRLGSNGEDEFRSTSSKAGAVGLMQFMPKTYKMIQQKYPSAKLPDFNIGANNHVFAIMAAVLLHDYHSNVLVKSFGENILNDKNIKAYLVGAYNGGPASVITAIKKSQKSGNDWSDHLKRRETQIYVEEWEFLKSR